MILLIKQTYLKTPNFNFTEFVVCAVGWIISRVGRSGSVVVIYDVSAMRYAGYIDMIWYRVSCEARVFETEKSVFLGRCIWYVHRESKESTSEVVDFVPVVSVRSVLYRNVMYTKNSTQIHPPLSLWLVQCWYRTLPSISRQVWFTSVNSSIRSPCRIREWMQLPRWLVQRNVFFLTNQASPTFFTLSCYMVTYSSVATVLTAHYGAMNSLAGYVFTVQNPERFTFTHSETLGVRILWTGLCCTCLFKTSYPWTRSIELADIFTKILVLKVIVIVGAFPIVKFIALV